MRFLYISFLEEVRHNLPASKKCLISVTESAIIIKKKKKNFTELGETTKLLLLRWSVQISISDVFRWCGSRVVLPGSSWQAATERFKQGLFLKQQQQRRRRSQFRGRAM